MPILNHRDYRSAKAQIVQLSRALGPNRVLEDIASHMPAGVADARQEALRAELQRLRAEVAAYERLRGGEVSTETEIDIEDLGLLPILGRIARQLSQRELAERLDVKEQQIQRYESERYAGVSLARYQRILDVLGIELHPRLTPGWSGEEQRASKQQAHIEMTPDLLREIRKRRWLEIPGGIGGHEAADLISSYIERSSQFSKQASFHRRSSTADAQYGANALAAWRARVLQVAAERRGRIRARFNIADARWLRSLVMLSVYPDGPLRAAELLKEKGIVLVIEPQLPHTLLDGAALLILESVPVVGLTLRHDRLDNFWFTLLHELGHIYLHFNHGLDSGFLDDLDETPSARVESEADNFAQSHLLPDEIWNASPARFSKTADLIRSFAESRNVHPAIVAGRIRRDRGNYRIFDDLVGLGQVRRLFLPQPG